MIQIRGKKRLVDTLSALLSIGLLPSFLKKRYYRMRGAKIGKGVSIGFLSIIDASRIEIGDYSRIGMMVRIKAKQFRMGAYSQIRHSTTIAAPRVTIGNETTISHDVVIGGMDSWDSRFVIGDRCTIFPHSFINPTKNVIIGNDVGIGGSNYLFTHGSWSNALEGFPMSFGPIVIEDRVWLPWRVFVLPNVTIGHDAVIAAGSVVTKSVPPLSLAAGVPAKVVKSGNDFVTPQTKEQKLSTILRWLGEFSDFLKIEGLQFESIQLSEHIHWGGVVRNARGSNIGTVVLASDPSRDSPSSIERNTHLVTLDSLPPELKKQIESSGGAWFDLSKYEWSGSRNRLAVELRVFMERYGIRFESVDLRKKS